MKKRKLPASKTDMVYRAGLVEAIPDGNDGIPLILATESPVRMWDQRERSIMGEVLRMDGLSLPSQLPLLNSHNRERARDVIGSIRDLEITGGQLRGKAYFASNDEAQSIRQLYLEGHMTDFSIGFEPGDVERVRSGESKTIGGQTYKGPTRVVTTAKVREGSAVPIGADENAKALIDAPGLRAYVCPDDLLRSYEMDKLRDVALLNGMPADTPDEDVERWFDENMVSRANLPKEEPPNKEPEEIPKGAGEERARCAKIIQYCERYNVSPAQQASFIASSRTAEQIADHLILHHTLRTSGKELGTQIEPIESEQDKFNDGARGALIQRCLMGVDISKAKAHAEGQYEQRSGHTVNANFRDYHTLEGVEEVERLIKSPVSRDFRNVGLFDLARMYVERAGVNVHGMSRNQIAVKSLEIDRLMQRDAAYHTTGSFTNILLDAANKTLLMAYSEADVTYPLWVRQAPSTADYKTINRMRLGEIPDPQIVPENHPYGEAPVSDTKESYVPDKYGNIFSISLEAIVNDDLNAISRIPAQQGYAMRRKINKVCYAVLTANAALSDGVALFHATSHGANLDANALSVSALNTGWTVMATQAGIQSGTILNIQPRYLIVPAALAATALQIVGSLADPSNTSGSTEDASRPNYNSGTLNIYGPNGSRPLTPVVEGQLDGTSATGWYLAATPNQVDTVELTFLQGEETPYLAREETFEVDCVRYKIRQTFGAKAIDYRGLYQGNS